MLTIITGASSNHFNTLMQFLSNITYSESQKDTRVIVYDLGLRSNELLRMKKKFGEAFIYEKFDFSKYPSYVNIRIAAGQYAWKPIILNDVCKKYYGKLGDFDKYFMWCDAGTLFKGRQTRVRNILKEHHIFTPESSGVIRTWTHPSTLRYMGWKGPLNLKNRTGGFIGVDYSVEWVKSLVQNWRDLALTPQCICPPGSSRRNHRQDQAVLTILYYMYQMKYKFKIIDAYFNFSTQNDIR